jgi:hypothetical protein
MRIHVTVDAECDDHIDSILMDACLKEVRLRMKDCGFRAVRLRGEIYQAESEARKA